MKKLFWISVTVFGLLLSLPCMAQDHQDNDHGRDQGYGDRHDRWQGRLSANDQSRFDSYYSRWLDYQRTNNRDQMASMENRMRDVMARNSIPPDTEFSRIASPSAGQYRRRNIPRFSGDDARRFNSYYSRWQEYQRTNNRDQIASMEGRMRDVMNRHNVPGDVSYDEMMNVLNGRGR
ncbi:MAG: hypothetical protein ACHP8A_01950 [Terriglobales bacterium]|jgi:hypothetical protein|nr:hypothetical protein [Terriglobales bacterium]